MNIEVCIQFVDWLPNVEDVRRCFPTNKTQCFVVISYKYTAKVN